MSHPTRSIEYVVETYAMKLFSQKKSFFLDIPTKGISKMSFCGALWHYFTPKNALAKFSKQLSSNAYAYKGFGIYDNLYETHELIVTPIFSKTCTII